MLITAPDQEDNRDIFSIFFNMKVCCVLLLESPHRGDSNENTQYTIFNIKQKITLNYPNKSTAVGFFPGDSRMSSKQRDKGAISVRANEVLLYNQKLQTFTNHKMTFFPA